MYALNDQDLLERKAYTVGFGLSILPGGFMLQRYAPDEDGHCFGTIDEADAFLRGYLYGILTG
jgi:hypothetical protein